MLLLLIKLKRKVLEGHLGGQASTAILKKRHYFSIYQHNLNPF
jgi:hypothetical protein